MVKITPRKPDNSSSSGSIALSPQQLKWQQQGYGASRQDTIETVGPDGQVISTEVMPEEPSETREITPDEAYKRSQGGMVKAKSWQRAMNGYARGKVDSKSAATSLKKPNR